MPKVKAKTKSGKPGKPQPPKPVIISEKGDDQIICEEAMREKVWLDDVILSIDAAIQAHNVEKDIVNTIRQKCYSIS